MTVVHNKQRIVEVRKNVGRGADTIVITAPFLPDFIRAEFSDKGDAAQADSIYWEMAASAGPYAVGQYDITVTYAVTNHPRDIKIIISKLPKDAETISH